LGSSLLPTYTGGSAIGQGGCTHPQPIVIYADVTTPLLNATLLQQMAPQQQVFPSAGVATSRTSMAAGATQVVLAVAGNSSAWIYVYDKTLTTLLSPAFTMSSLAFNACNGTSGAGPTAWPQVLWDGPAQRWLLLEATEDALHLCLYVSLGADALAGFQASPYTLDAGDGYDTTYPQLALWGTTYTLTLAQCKLCVIDRAAVLLGDPGAAYFCALALNGLLPAFVINAWTPLHAEGNVAPTSEVEDAGADSPTAGAVFMRAIDDELQYGVTTSQVDLLEVEHWYAINYTDSSYFALRYRIAVADFDQSYALCPSIDVCIPTPSSWELDPIREPLMPRLVYRPASGVLATMTSHANGVSIARYYWFQLQWVSPFWTLYQQGISNSSDGLHKWMPSASIDTYGNMAIAYCVSNTSVWPSLYADMRLASDFPLGVLRNTTLLLATGPTPSHLVSTQWGQANAMVSDPALGRLWYFAGQYGATAPEAWAVQTSRIEMGEQLVARNWSSFVSDWFDLQIYCNLRSLSGLLRERGVVFARDNGCVILNVILWRICVA
jgi:hypothetical protein